MSGPGNFADMEKPSGTEGCGFLQAVDGHIVSQRGYRDELSFLVSPFVLRVAGNAPLLSRFINLSQLLVEKEDSVLARHR